MEILKAITRKGDRMENEDSFGYTDNALWVIDGATDLFNLGLFEGDDVAFYVKKLNDEIKSQYNETDSLKQIIKQAILSLNNKINLNIKQYETYKYPSFAIAMVRFVDDKLEYLVLGDCTVLIDTGIEILNFTDTRISAFSKYNKQKIKEMKSKGIFNKENELSLFQSTRTMMNTENGYWIGSIDPVGLEHALVGEISANRNTKVICCTDGFFEAFELFNISKIDETIFNEKILSNIEKELETKQDKDLERNIVRVRVKDDLTYVFVRC